MANSKSGVGCGCLLLYPLCLLGGGLIASWAIGNYGFIHDLIVYGNFHYLIFDYYHLFALIMDIIILGVILYFVINGAREKWKLSFDKKVEKFHQQKEATEKSAIDPPNNSVTMIQPPEE